MAVYSFTICLRPSRLILMSKSTETLSFPASNMSDIASGSSATWKVMFALSMPMEYLCRVTFKSVAPCLIASESDATSPRAMVGADNCLWGLNILHTFLLLISSGSRAISSSMRRPRPFCPQLCREKEMSEYSVLTKFY